MARDMATIFTSHGIYVVGISINFLRITVAWLQLGKSKINYYKTKKLLDTNVSSHLRENKRGI